MEFSMGISRFKHILVITFDRLGKKMDSRAPMLARGVHAKTGREHLKWPRRRELQLPTISSF